MATHNCIVLDMKLDGRLPFGKHEQHRPHDWWYTSYGGGHQMGADWEPDGTRYGTEAYDSTERWVHQHHCPGI